MPESKNNTFSFDRWTSHYMTELFWVTYVIREKKNENLLLVSSGVCAS